MRILRPWRSDTVHAHLVAVGLASLIVARLTGLRRRVYARQHSTFHHRCAPRGGDGGSPEMVVYYRNLTDAQEAEKKILEILRLPRAVS